MAKVTLNDLLGHDCKLSMIDAKLIQHLEGEKGRKLKGIMW